MNFKFQRCETVKYLIAAFLLLFPIALDCSAQSIADAARKERARQQQSRSTITIIGITNSTAETAKGMAGITTAGTAAAGAVAGKPSGPADSTGRDEKYWRTAFQKARDDVKKADEKVQLLELRVKDLNTGLLTRSDIYNRENVLGVQITDSQKQLDAANKDADQAKQKVADLEEELRKSGGPAGWAR